MTATKQLLTSADIKGMTLEEYMRYTPDRYKAVSAVELCEANSDWLVICDLERVKNVAELRKLIKQLKEDLWWEIHDGGKNG